MDNNLQAAREVLSVIRSYNESSGSSIRLPLPEVIAIVLEKYSVSASVASTVDDEPDNLRLAPLGHALSSITSPMGQTPEVVTVWNEFWKLNAQLNKTDCCSPCRQRG